MISIVLQHMLQGCSNKQSHKEQITQILNILQKNNFYGLTIQYLLRSLMSCIELLYIQKKKNETPPCNIESGVFQHKEFICASNGESSARTTFSSHNCYNWHFQAKHGSQIMGYCFTLQSSIEGMWSMRTFERDETKMAVSQHRKLNTYILDQVPQI